MEVLLFENAPFEFVYRSPALRDFPIGILRHARRWSDDI
jgi:hypothetical protein